MRTLRTPLLAAAVFAFVAPVSWAQKGDGAADQVAVPPAAHDADPKIPFEKYTLDNGIEVILLKDNTVPIVAVDVWYHVGSGCEVPGKSGFAHLFEHMMFQGSKNVGEDKHFDILKKIGATDVNGTTNSDRTNYFEVIPSDQLETGLWLESDRMGFLLPLLTQDSMSNQIQVVLNERRQSYENRPYGNSSLQMSSMLYPEGHPYRYQTIGKHDDIANANLDDVRNFFKTWYVPANATITIAGDFDTDTAKKLVTKWFGSFPKSTKPQLVDVPAPVVEKQRAETKDSFAKLRRIDFAWVTPAFYQPGDGELDLLGEILGGGDASRLSKLLVDDKKVAQSVYANQQSAQFSSEFHIVVTLRSDADVATVEQLVEQEVGKVRDAQVTDRELSRAKTDFEANFVRGLEDVFARAQLLQSYNHYLGDPDKVSWDLDRHRNVTADDVQKVAQQYLSSDHEVELVTVPAGGNP